MSSFVVVAAVGAGVLAGPALRWEAFRSSVPHGTEKRKTCSGCAGAVIRIGRGWSGQVALLAGRCGDCGLRFGPPATTVELAAAAAFAALAVATHEVLPLLAYCWLAGVGFALAMVDVAVHRLPDRLTAILAAGVLMFLGLQAATSHDVSRLLEASASAAGAALFYAFLWAVTSEGMGLGDAKLAFGLGLAVGWNGWAAVFAAVTLGLLLTGMTAAVLLALRRARRKDAIPHGPFMVLGSLAVILLVQM